MQALNTIWSYLAYRPGAELLAFFWLVVWLDIPRYFFGFVSAVVVRATEEATSPRMAGAGRVSVLIAGHNEEDAMERCVRSLRAQTLADLEIICVDDGSTDRTLAVLAALSRKGLIDQYLSVKCRGGKSAALNLAAERSTGDILVVVDCDCTFAADAVEHLVRPLQNPAVGAAAGAILVRNASASIMSSLQALEYMFSVQLGRTVLDFLGIVTCVSGAMGAFTRKAWNEVGGMDVGPGEDFDLTLRLRQRGYKIRFAANALCWTDVPETLAAFLRQRRRWERDAIRIRLRKFGFTLNPFSPRFRLAEALHQVEFLIFPLLSSIAFLIYLVMALTIFPQLVPVVLLAVTLLLICLDAVTLFLAAFGLKTWGALRLLPFIPLFAPFQFLIMRNARLFAYVEEMIFSTSRRDNFVPWKVRRWMTWY